MEDDVLNVNLEALKIREIEEIEEITGTPIDQLFDAERPRGQVLRALGYVVKRRDNPDFTLEDAGELVIKVADADPTTAGA